MTLRNPDGNDDVECRRCFIIFPRMGKMMSRDKVQTPFIWLGVYLAESPGPCTDQPIAV